MNKFIKLASLFVAAVLTSASTGAAQMHCPSDNTVVWTNCYGTFNFENGDTYTGNFNDDQFDGIGTYTTAEGNTFVGKYKNDKRNGTGTFTNTDGDTFVGEYKDGERNGPGTYTAADGSKFIGEYKTGERNGSGMLARADGGTFVGEYKDDARNGPGIFTNTDGDTFIGQFRDDARNGTGTYSSASGNKFVGEYKDSARSGLGTYTNSDGDTFVGQYRDGEKNGLGTYISTNGDTFVGEYKNGKMNGLGYYIFSDGSADFCDYLDGKDKNCQGTNVYDVAPILKQAFDALSVTGRKAIQSGLQQRGLYDASLDGKWGRGTLAGLGMFSVSELKTINFKDTQAANRLIAAVLASSRNHIECPSDESVVWTNCYGTFVAEKGDSYTGNFKDDQFDGEGTYTYANGDTFAGEFKDGKRIGLGTYTDTDGDTFVGEYKGDARNGPGIFTNTDGDTFVGVYRDGARNGPGNYTNTDGDRFVGQYRDGKRNGRGTYTFSGGDTFVGEYKDSARSGLGTYTNADGDTFVGQYRDDARNGLGTYITADGSTFVGEYKNGKMNGPGYYIFSDGSADFCDYLDGKDRNCQGTNVYDVAPILKQAFDALSVTGRKAIQSGLQQRGLYDASLDGKWRRETFIGLARFAAVELNTVILLDPSFANQLIDTINSNSELAISDTHEPSCDTNPQLCTIAQLCEKSVVAGTIENTWRKDAINARYVAEAKSNGLSCGVERSVAESNELADGQLIKGASGTGFYVSKAAHIITNNHVIDGCSAVMAHSAGKILETEVIAKDPRNDLALLKSKGTTEDILALGTDNPYPLQDIIVAGFPFGEDVSSSIKFTKGVISSLSGVGNNYSQIQIDAALQPGNSGGPIVDEFGNVIAVAVAKLDLQTVYDSYGVVPEDANFGVKASVVRNLLEGNRVALESPNTMTVSKKELSGRVAGAVVYLTCWMTPEQIRNLSSSD